MRKMTNRSHLEGFVYQHNLKKAVSGPNSAHPGTEYIAGELEIMTDNAGLNIVPVHYTYVAATTSSGKENAAFKVLSDIVGGKIGTVMGNGQDKAAMVRIDTSIGLNDFYSDKSGQEELVSAKRNEGGFIHVVNAVNEDEKERNYFEADIIITRVTIKEADPDRDLPEKAIVKGAIFDFRNAMLPVELSVVNPHAIRYFESLEASEKNPVFTKIKGRQVSEVIVRKIVEEGAFGEPSVRETKNTRKDWVITWAAKEPYEWDSEETITAQEFLKAISDRNTYLATVKQRNDEYKASRSQAPAAFSTTATATANSEFRF